MKLRLASGLILALAPPLLWAQGPPPGRALRVGDSGLEQVVGFSWFSPGGSLGWTTHRRLYVTGIRSTSVVAASKHLAIVYAVELVPLAVVERTGPNTRICWMDGDEGVCEFDRSVRVAAGAGGSPIGIRTYWNRTGRWRVHAGGGAGMLMFTSDVPIYNSRRLNFTFEYGTGVEVATSGGRAITMGWRFHHISNGGLGHLNPGLDANVIYFGLTKDRSAKSGK